MFQIDSVISDLYCLKLNQQKERDGVALSGMVLDVRLLCGKGEDYLVLPFVPLLSGNGAAQGFYGLD